MGAIQLLIEAKAEIEQATDDGRTALYAASSEGHPPAAVRVLLEAGACSAELMYKGKYSPLHVAADQGHLECVKLLTGFRPNTAAWNTVLLGSKSECELKASLQRRSRRRPGGSRPAPCLPRIYKRDYLQVIWEFQRERYSDLYLKNGHNGMTALEMAELQGEAEVAALLRSLMVL